MDGSGYGRGMGVLLIGALVLVVLTGIATLGALVGLVWSLTGGYGSPGHSQAVGVVSLLVLPVAGFAFWRVASYINGYSAYRK